MKVYPTHGPGSTRRGFTLVELLTVIVIISILAGLVTVAAQMAIKGAKRATISTEVTQLSMALQKYKDERGDYPPDFSGADVQISGNYPVRQAIIRHLRRAFPKYRPGITSPTNRTGWLGFCDDVNVGSNGRITIMNAGETATIMTPDAALVFWLGGIPDADGRLEGFSANPANPFALGGTRLPVYFEFDETRLARDTATSPYRYVPPHATSPDGVVGAQNVAPYVYFQARSRNYLIPGIAANTVKTYQPTSIPGVGTACPYARRNDDPNVPFTNFATIKWFDDEKFQIICCGLDGTYLNPNTTIVATNPAHVRYLAEDQNNLTPEEDDNQTSFAQGALGDWSEAK